MDVHQSPDDPLRPAKRSPGTPAILTALVLGAVIGGMAVEYWLVKTGAPTTAAQSAASTPVAASSATLIADVEHLKAVLPTQSHIMIDVAHHWALLWFAADKRNWPLARAMFDEARQSVRWAIVMRPVRKLPDGTTVNVKGIFDAIDPSVFASVQLTIEDKNHDEFVAAYKQTLEACYSCHKAVGRPEIRPMIPTAPPTTILNFDPSAKWPE